VVIRLPGQELVAAAGDTATARAIGSLRAPLIVAAALATLKWTMITPVEPDGPPLHVVALRDPLEAADGLMIAGLSPSGLADLAGKLGIVSPLDPEALSHGTATVTPIELASALAAIAEAGQHRMLQVLRTIDGTAESEGARAALPVLIPEVAYLTANLMQSWKPPVPAKSKHGDGAWTTLVSPDAVVLVWVGFPDGKPLPDSGEAERASQAIARDVQTAALKGQKRSFNRPRGLIARRVDGFGKVLPQTAAGGVEEWFAPGSVPRSED
jgi:membrane peptidoglycan carboxypeptidase